MEVWCERQVLENRLFILHVEVELCDREFGCVWILRVGDGESALERDRCVGVEGVEVVECLDFVGCLEEYVVDL